MALFSHAVDLTISNTSNRDIWATVHTDNNLTHVALEAIRTLIGNITTNDLLTIYFDQHGQKMIWGKFRIVLGGQRNDPIDLTFAGSAYSGGYELQDILGEPGEGGYNIQDLYEKTLPLKELIIAIEPRS
jgi:hypothetical protein